jgi:hypothetical protein
MGAWGHTNYANDAAHDFAMDVTEQGVDKIKTAIHAVTSCGEEDILESDECCEALAAIEFIATAKGKMAEDFPENAEEWLAGKDVSELTSPELIRESQQAIARIKSNSELKELWNEGGEFDEWVKVVDDLEKRISS